MRCLTPLLLLTSGAALAQTQADSHYPPGEMARARHEALHHHGASTQTFLQADRLERSAGDGERGLAWEAQGWIGQDLHKLWLKTEGERDLEAGEAEEAELQVLYSRAVSPWFDLQAGLRHDFAPGDSREHLVLGLQGLAPQWFEVDAAAFLSEDGELGARLEAEYDLRLSQRLLLQPRLELEAGSDEDREAGHGSGLRETSLGLRLRYELRREFAPYLGVEWSRAYGGTAALRRAAGGDDEDFRVLLGLRVWY